MEYYVGIYTFEESYKPYLIKIFNEYIYILKKNNIYIYDINNYNLIKELNFSFNIYKSFNFDEKKILVTNEYSFILYDLSDINDIKYQKLYIVDDNKVQEIKEKNYNDIKKLSEGKMMVYLSDYCFIYEFTKNLQPLIINSH